MDSITIQTELFDAAAETARLQTGNSSTGKASIGAVVTFIGLVRDVNEGAEVAGLTLEHYPGMAEKTIGKIVEEARQRWPLEAVRVVHRVGELKPMDPIVYVGVASQHRSEAFAACEFIMDYLKTRAPFWKKEMGADSIGQWLDGRDSDQLRLQKWQVKHKK